MKPSLTLKSEVNRDFPSNDLLGVRLTRVAYQNGLTTVFPRAEYRLSTPRMAVAFGPIHQVLRPRLMLSQTNQHPVQMNVILHCLVPGDPVGACKDIVYEHAYCYDITLRR